MMKRLFKPKDLIKIQIRTSTSYAWESLEENSRETYTLRNEKSELQKQLDKATSICHILLNGRKLSHKQQTDLGKIYICSLQFYDK